jgi:tryptophanyl-tRNA synthetase
MLSCNIQKTKENIPTDSDRNTIKEHLNKATTNKQNLEQQELPQKPEVRPCDQEGLISAAA